MRAAHQCTFLSEAARETMRLFVIHLRLRNVASSEMHACTAPVCAAPAGDGAGGRQPDW